MPRIVSMVISRASAISSFILLLTKTSKSDSLRMLLVLQPQIVLGRMEVTSRSG